MSRIKLSIAMLAAVLAVGAGASPAASAATPGWMVGGTNLPANSKVALMTKEILHLFGFEVIAGSVTLNVQCGGLETVNGEIIGTNRGFASSLVFTECALTSGGPPCELGTKTAGTLPLLITEVTLDGPLGIKGRFVPETKTIFATFRFNGVECALAGVQPITGKVEFLAPLGQDEMTWQPVLFLGELKVGSSEAKSHALALLATANLVPWSFL